jgi:4-hydroxybenzoate polyprenyltransferase
MTADYVHLMRIKHWIKNVFIFAPLIFSRNFYKPSYIGRTLLMCAAFCLAASAVYILNDVADRERDRLHPKKKHRPIASGAVPVPRAFVLSLLLAAAGISISSLSGARGAAVVLAYIGINVAYSFLLKNQTFIDVMVIATGFLLRVAAGAAAIDVQLSHWMLLSTFFLSLFLGFGKRRKEMLVTGGSTQHRAVFEQYSVDLLNCLIVVSAALTIITYSLYVVSSKTIIALGSDLFIATIPFVVFGVFRYLFQVYRQNNGGDPAEVLLKDTVMIVDVLLWVFTIFGLLGFAVISGAVK